MRILLCDDDEKILQQMNQYLLEFFHLAKLRPPQIKVYTSGDELAASGDVGDIAILRCGDAGSQRHSCWGEIETFKSPHKNNDFDVLYGLFG